MALLSPALSRGGPQANKAAEEAPSLPAGGRTSEIIISGKLFCPLKRTVAMAFPGRIVELRVQAGQPVREGERLACYRLTPEGVMQLRRRLYPGQLKELEMRLAEVNKNITSQEAKHQGLQQLVREKLASPQKLTQLERELGLLYQQKRNLQQALEQERRLVQEDQVLLRQILGQPVKPGQVPELVSLIAPLDGYVVWVNPDLRLDAEMATGTPAFQIGVMDPMVIKARVHEIEAAKLKIGDTAEVSLDSLPDRKFQAKVSQLPWSSPSISLEQPSYYVVEFEVPNPDLALKEGLKARIILQKPR